MNGSKTKALLWKEWRETRWKFLAFFLAFHPVVWIATVALLVDKENRFSFQTTPAKAMASDPELWAVGPTVLLVAAAASFSSPSSKVDSGIS